MDSIGYLGIVVTLVGLAAAFFTGRGHVRARASIEAAKRWPAAPGTVIASQVDRRCGSSGRNAYYVPTIQYSYVVNGRERQGARLRFGATNMRSRSGAEAALAPYPAGADIQVRYDPADPDQAVLEPDRMSSYLLIVAILSAVVLLIGAFIVVLAMRGTFSADVSGRWHVRFEGDGAVYEGELEAIRGAGPLTLSYNGPQGSKRAIEDCTLTRNRQHVLVRCANPRMLQGTGTYSADNFDLTYQGASRLAGSVTSNGQPVGNATFSR
jgi:hypothetical protein